MYCTCTCLVLVRLCWELCRTAHIIASVDTRLWSPCRRSLQEGGLTKLLERIAQLHKENVVLHTRCEEVGEELKAMKAEKVRLEDELIMSKDVPVKVSIN